MILAIAVGWTLGVWWLQLQPQLPFFGAAGVERANAAHGAAADGSSSAVLDAWAVDPLLLAWVGVALILAVLARRLDGRAALALSGMVALQAGFVWAAWLASERIGQILPADWEGKDIVVTGRITDLPVTTERGTRFFLVADRAWGSQPWLGEATTLALTWYGRAPDLRAGDRWQLTVRLKRPHASQNPDLPDMQAWWLAHGVVANGYVREPRGATGGHRLGEAPGFWAAIDRLRDTIRRQVVHVLPAHDQVDVLLALAIGDQRAIDRGSWQLFQRTGVAHLMSISGLHVTMIGLAGKLLIGWLWRRSPAAMVWLPTPVVAATGGAITAMAYAALAGFGVPAVRTALMVSAVALAVITSWRTSIVAVLALALLVIVVTDPWAPLSPGFWLSFGAVALLVAADRAYQTSVVERGLLAGAATTAKPEPRSTAWAKKAWAELGAGSRAQLAVTLGLAPLGVLLFSQFSLVSPLANALAIPVVSFIVTPLALLGCVTAFADIGLPLRCAAEVMDALLAVLRWIDGPWSVWYLPAPSPAVFALATAAIITIFWPARLRLRWRLAASLGLLPMVLFEPPAPRPGEYRLLYADIGQGSAVIIQTQHHWAVFDTGPAMGTDADAGDRVLMPLLRAQGARALDALIVSHDDIDHAGGAQSIVRQLAVHSLFSSMDATHPLGAHSLHQRCAAGQGWQWDGVRFQFVHPQPDTSYREDNARSCVLLIQGEGGASLLTGDIPAAQEADLIAREDLSRWGRLQVLMVPHHGSKTSSSQGFLQTLMPQLAIAQMGYRSRFGHPHPKVAARYRELGIPMLRTDLDGAVDVLVRRDGQLAVTAQREARRRYWHLGAGSEGLQAWRVGGPGRVKRMPTERASSGAGTQPAEEG